MFAKSVQDLDFKLFSYFRSSCSYRLRIILNFKGIPYQYIPVNLLKLEHKNPEYLLSNPTGKVPTLMIDGTPFTQSIATAEFLEELFPDLPSLLPKQPLKRFLVREIVNDIACDIQPVQNLPVLGRAKKIATNAGVTDNLDLIVNQWVHDTVCPGFKALEKRLETSSGLYCVGDDLTLADVCLAPQVYNAKRFGVQMDEYPILSKIHGNILKNEAVIKAHPSNQPDCPDTQDAKAFL